MVYIASAAALWATSPACKPGPGNAQQRGKPISGKAIQAVLAEHTDSLMSLPGVVGTAIGECAGKPCIKVLVVRNTPALRKKIPATLEGFLVAVEETGEIRALDSR
jgi:hypothetical protein